MDRVKRTGGLYVLESARKINTQNVQTCPLSLYCFITLYRAENIVQQLV